MKKLEVRVLCDENSNRGPSPAFLSKEVYEVGGLEHRPRAGLAQVQ